MNAAAAASSAALATSSKRHIAIIGAGMAGLTCARILQEEGGHQVTLFEKSKGPGGRIASRQATSPSSASTFHYDHGAPHFNAITKEFKAEVQRWKDEGWILPSSLSPPHHYLAVPSMNSLTTQHLAQDLNIVPYIHISSLERLLSSSSAAAAGEGERATNGHSRSKWRLHAREGGRQNNNTSSSRIQALTTTFDIAIVAIPAEQSAVLLEPFDAHMLQAMKQTKSIPCLTVMASWANPLGLSKEVYIGVSGEAPAVGSTVEAGRREGEAAVGGSDETKGVYRGAEAAADDDDKERVYTRSNNSEEYDEDGGVLSIARRDDTRPGRGGVEGISERWVLHASLPWSIKNFEVDRKVNEEKMLQAFAQLVGKKKGEMDKPVHTANQRWMLCQVPHPWKEAYGWNEGFGLGACGDAWAGGEKGEDEAYDEEGVERIEGGPQGFERAWLSGRALGKQIVASLQNE